MNLFLYKLLFLFILLIQINKQSVLAQSNSFIEEKKQFQKQTKPNSSNFTLFSIIEKTNNNINNKNSITEPMPLEKLIQNDEEILLLPTHYESLYISNDISNVKDTSPITKTKFSNVNEPMLIRKNK